MNENENSNSSSSSNGPLHDIANWPDQPEMVYHMPYLEDMASRCSVIIEIGCGHGNGSTRAFKRGVARDGHDALEKGIR